MSNTSNTSNTSKTFNNLTSSTLTVASTVADTVSNTVWGLMSQSKQSNSGLDKLTQSQLIQIGDYIQDIFRNRDVLNPPNICVIGSQSSGKSITLNGLVGFDILPNGKSIVTRTPIHLRLIHVDKAKEILVDFYDRNDLQKVISQFKVDPVTTPKHQLDLISNEIMRLTNEYAGSSKNVVDIPINIKIRSPNVPNLSVIDLPGLTNIALTDQGQPETIKENIEAMLSNYIKNPRTIILSIIPAIIDVESDMGLGLIKKFDPEFKRTIGVITKIDLLRDSDVNRFLSEDISKNLKLAYGYYAVRNRSSSEVQTMSVKDGYTLEKKFFDETRSYKNSDHTNRMGILNLGNRMSEILIAHLRACLPTVIEEIKNIDRDVEKQLDEIGRDYPKDEGAKRSMLNILLHEFQREYHSSIMHRGATYNTGAKISDSYMKFKRDMDKLDPFNNSYIYSDQVINEIIRDYNGIHMPDVAISTGVIEKCFQGIEHLDKNGTTKIAEPLMLIKPPFVDCINEIRTIMGDLIDTILQRDRFSRFPNLCLKIKETITTSIIPVEYESVYNKTMDFLKEEKECIWTNNSKFRCEVLPNMFTRSKDGSIDPKIIRTVLTGYFNVIKNIADHCIHKKIQTFFVNSVINDINTKLTDHILLHSNINKILEENKEKAQKRERLLNLKLKIDTAKNMIDGVE